MNRRGFLGNVAKGSVALGLAVAGFEAAGSTAWAGSRSGVESVHGLGTRGFNLDKWMDSVPDGTRIMDMSIPGTHDSAASIDGQGAGFAQCQRQSIRWQLDNGVRYLDIRCRAIDGAFALHHGPYYLGRMFGDVLNDCVSFLSRNRSETILMRVQQEHSTDVTEYERIFRDYYLEKWKSLFYTDRMLPTLDQARGKVVLMTSYPNTVGPDFVNNSTFSIQDNYNDPSEKSKKQDILDQFQAAYGKSRGDKLYVNHTSANGVGGSTWTPWSYSKEMNPYILSLLTSQLTPGKPVGVIAMDYVEKPYADWGLVKTDLIEAVIAWNPRKSGTESYKLDLDRVELISFDDGSTDPAVYGTIRVVELGGYSYNIWDRTSKAGSRVIFPDSRGDFEIYRPTLRSTNGFTVSADLWDYDASSSDDLVASGAITWSPADGLGSFSKDLTGEDDGRVRFHYRVSR